MVLDVLRERKPRFVPRDVVVEFAALLKAYGCTNVLSDRYGGGFHRRRVDAQRNPLPGVDEDYERQLFALPADAREWRTTAQRRHPYRSRRGGC